MFFTKPILANCSRTRPLFTNYSRSNPFLGFLVNTIRERLAKVRDHCSPNPLFRLSGEHYLWTVAKFLEYCSPNPCFRRFGEHCSWTVCQGSWTLFIKLSRSRGLVNIVHEPWSRDWSPRFSRTCWWLLNTLCLCLFFRAMICGVGSCVSRCCMSTMVVCMPRVLRVRAVIARCV